MHQIAQNITYISTFKQQKLIYWTCKLFFWTVLQSHPLQNYVTSFNYCSLVALYVGIVIYDNYNFTVVCVILIIKAKWKFREKNCLFQIILYSFLFFWAFLILPKKGVQFLFQWKGFVNNEVSIKSEVSLIFTLSNPLWCYVVFV